MRSLSMEDYITERRNALIQAKGDLPKLEMQLSDLQIRIDAERTSNNHVKRILWDMERSRAKLRKQIERLRAGTDVDELDRLSKPYLDIYHQEAVFKEMETSIPQRKPWQPKTPFAGMNDIRTESAIYREFLSDYANRAPSIGVSTQDICKICDVTMTLMTKQACLACPNCGRSTGFLDATSSALAYGDEVEFTSFTYKRINHFNEWLNLFQGKESTEIPPAIFQRIMERLYEKGYHRSEKVITRSVIEIIMRELGMRKYYEHKQLILSRITGEPPPRMTPEQEEQARVMFMAIQAPFEKWKKILEPKRKNFLSYSYLLYKFCQLRGWNQFLPCFTLLKGADKLAKQDRLFEKICMELDWQYVPSRGG